MQKYRDYAPALKWGAKIMPEDIAGMIGISVIGDIFYVDPNSGSDTANSGATQDDALKTVAAAYAKCTSGQNDVVLIAPTGGSGRTTEATHITWAKRFTHLIGNGAPTWQSVRSGMTFSEAALSSTTAQFTVTENGCIFKNITFYNDVADSLLNVKVTGEYNYFENCHFAGMANETAGNDADATSVTLSGAGENRFYGCTFGVDTVARTAANGSLAVAGMSPRNVIENCLFVSFIDATAPFHIKVADSGVDRWLWLKNCTFINADVSGGCSTMTDIMSYTAGVNDLVFFDNCSSFGATGLTSGTAGVYNSTPAANATGGISTVATS